MKLKLVFLGTGTSQGVPIIGCNCRVCVSKDIKDQRLRSSLLVKVNSHNILIDIGPDFRTQMLNTNNTDIDIVLITHQHRDHTAGLDDLRPIYYLNKKPIILCAENKVIESLKNDFQYIFNDFLYPGKPEININSIDTNPFSLYGVLFTPIRVMHHKLPILGYRIGDMSYITDANYIALEEKKKLLGSKVLIINSLQKERHISHYNLEQSLKIIHELKPKKAYLTHISHNMGLYSDISKELPSNVFLGYDGLQLEI
tara:strand:+ start:2281 stop:3048 length:768 start_codon:yes stop_codon:yes gene_type:complete